MKTNTIYRANSASLPNLPCPNAATRRQMFQKLLDLLLTGAIGAGAAAILLFLSVLA